MSNLDLILLFSFGLGLGFGLGMWYAWHRWLCDAKPTLHITVDKDVLSAVTQEMVMDWLNKRDLTWQPKGTVFNTDRIAKP